MAVKPVRHTAHTEYLLHDYKSSRNYNVRDFLCISKRIRTEATIVACDLYYIPSHDAWYHEFLLVHVDISGDRLMLVIEHNPSNEDMWVILSGGVAKDTITVVRVREDHDYWKGVYPTPVCKGTLRWHGSSPRLLDIGFFASAASKTSKYYNLYIRQCLWYARIVLAAIGVVFPHCSREGTTLFSNKFAIFGSYKLSHVELLVDLHTNYCRELYSPTRCLAPVVPAMEARRCPSCLVVSDILHGLAMSPTRQEGYPILAGVRSFIK